MKESGCCHAEREREREREREKQRERDCKANSGGVRGILASLRQAVPLRGTVCERDRDHY